MAQVIKPAGYQTKDRQRINREAAALADPNPNRHKSFLSHKTKKDGIRITRYIELSLGSDHPFVAEYSGVVSEVARFVPSITTPVYPKVRVIRTLSANIPKL